MFRKTPWRSRGWTQGFKRRDPLVLLLGELRSQAMQHGQKQKTTYLGQRVTQIYEANDTHRRLSLSSPEKAPFMSSMLQEISLFFRSLVKKERYWNWHQICNKRYRLFSFFLIKVAQMRRAVIHVINYLQLHWAGLRCYVWASSRVCGLSACGSRAQLLCGMRNPPGPGIKPVSPAFLGGF